MKIDWEYMKGLLAAFEESYKPTTNIEDLLGRGFNYMGDEDRFVFHMHLLSDAALIEPQSGQKLPGTKAFGAMPLMGGPQKFSWGVMELRLTMAGHEFAANLKNKQIWDRIKGNIQEHGFTEIFRITKELAMAFAKKKAENLLKEE